MSEDVLCQLIAGLQPVKFAFKPNECTDIANAAKLLAYDRYFLEGDHITYEELFRVLGDFFDESELSWIQLVGVCPGRADVMTGRKSGLVAQIKIFAPHIALAAKDMNEDLTDAFSACIKNVNFIEARPLNQREELYFILNHHYESMAHFFTDET
ncbi:hypothetical protein RF11_11506 [Thelohanellus kitauei]|uniref:Uncharacterized protein n=1 Tax=Thelohanellus kitauei TaxID=669202 RepID=A0A0C2N4X9_THEKT|nr:hypothetical protein RF11_11506 [Thelohanellus kitauei]